MVLLLVVAKGMRGAFGGVEGVGVSWRHLIGFTLELARRERLGTYETSHRQIVLVSTHSYAQPSVNMGS